MKNLGGIDDDVLERAKRHLGTPTIKATVNAALWLAAGGSSADDDLAAALVTLAYVVWRLRRWARCRVWPFRVIVPESSARACFSAF